MPQSLAADIRKEITRVELQIDEMKSAIKRAVNDSPAIEKLALQLREHNVRLGELRRNLSNCGQTT